METLSKVAAAAVGCACSVVAVAEFGSGAVLGCIAFAAFWIAVGMLVPLTDKIASLLRTGREGEARDALGRCVAAPVACLSIVALYVCFVIIPVVGVAGVEQTGAGSFWLVCSMIAIPIALPIAASLAERLGEGD